MAERKTCMVWKGKVSTRDAWPGAGGLGSIFQGSNSLVNSNREMTTIDLRFILKK